MTSMMRTLLVVWQVDPMTQGLLLNTPNYFVNQVMLLGVMEVVMMDGWR